MNDKLENLRTYIEAYNDTASNDGNALNEILKLITIELSYLEPIRADFKHKFESLVYELTKDKKMTVARAVNEAETKYPELYLLRRVIDNAYRICDAIRTNISFLKSERQNYN